MGSSTSTSTTSDSRTRVGALVPCPGTDDFQRTRLDWMKTIDLEIILCTGNSDIRRNVAQLSRCMQNTVTSSKLCKFVVALINIRWRKSPSAPKQLQSNARILRWSDSSLTLQLASNPTTQYRRPGMRLHRHSVILRSQLQGAARSSSRP